MNRISTLFFIPVFSAPVFAGCQRARISGLAKGAGLLRRLAMALAMLLALASPAAADLDRDERAEIYQLIERFISENPEILRDALIALQEREEAARLEQALLLVRSDRADGVMGNPDGDVTIYEFSDYNCGYCKRMFKTLQSVLAADGQITLKVKEFPILAESSVIAARAGLAAQRQGKFEAFHSAMMQAVGSISRDSVIAVARKSGLDMDQLEKDMADPGLDQLLQANHMAARALGVTGTPALVIGDQLIPGAVDEAELRRLIDAARQASR